MLVVDARSHPGSQPVRPTIPSVDGGLLPSGRDPWCRVLIHPGPVPPFPEPRRDRALVRAA
jgi:hypothetical protein